jgi:hypothetical protein
MRTLTEVDVFFEGFWARQRHLRPCLRDHVFLVCLHQMLMNCHRGDNHQTQLIYRCHFRFNIDFSKNESLNSGKVHILQYQLSEDSDNVI